MATYFNEGVKLLYYSSNDDRNLQEQQINEMLEKGIDLLIVSPQQMGDLTKAVDKAYDSGIPVILFDRKTGSDKYTAFMGADNYEIGRMCGEFMVEQLHGQGCVVEIGGLKESSPAIDRTRGFRDVLKAHPGIQIVGFANGDWKEASGREAMRDILNSYDGPIDGIFGGNDRMALEAAKVLEHMRGKQQGLIVVGVDALPTQGKGISQVLEGHLSASAIYPTHGDELLALALKILNKEGYDRDNLMASSLVTPLNARVLLLQYEEVLRQGDYLRRMHQRIARTLRTLDTQRLVIIGFVLLLILGAFWTVFIIRISRQKSHLNKQLREKNDLLANQRDELETQRDQLRKQRDTLLEQHDQLCEQRDQMEAQRDELALQRDELKKLTEIAPVESVETIVSKDETNGPEDGRFYQRIQQILERNIGNSEFSVEQLSDAIGLSRAQMYRRCKQITGNSPVEMLRIQRMQRAGQLLSTTDQNISEVTYSCGFTSPSYFTKCFKEHYGMSPTDFVRHHHSNKHNPEHPASKG